MLVDFHGTAEGQEADNVEEYYALDAMNAVADELGFIVVRPRSRSIPTGDGTESLYQWDVNQGDLALNTAFTDALVASLESQYRVDTARRYASGFSNGTNMAVRFLGDPNSPFAGYAVVEGGLFSYDGDIPHAAFDATAPRIYATTGYRDYIYETQVALVTYLSQHQYPDARLWVRQTDSGHELYGWDYEEFLRWIDQGVKPGPQGVLSPGWIQEASFTSTDGLLKMIAAPGGVVLATGTGGDFWHAAPRRGFGRQRATSTAPSRYTRTCASNRRGRAWLWVSRDSWQGPRTVERAGRPRPPLLNTTARTSASRI